MTERSSFVFRLLVLLGLHTANLNVSALILRKNAEYFSTPREKAVWGRLKELFLEPAPDDDLLESYFFLCAMFRVAKSPVGILRKLLT